MPRVKIDPSKLPGKLPIPDPAICRAYQDKVLEMAGLGRVSYAYVPTMDAGAWVLSIVVDGQRGHYPMPASFCFGTEDQVRQVADHLNAISPDAVAKLIAQSMRAS